MELDESIFGFEQEGKKDTLLDTFFLHSFEERMRMDEEAHDAEYQSYMKIDVHGRWNVIQPAIDIPTVATRYQYSIDDDQYARFYDSFTDNFLNGVEAEETVELLGVALGNPGVMEIPDVISHTTDSDFRLWSIHESRALGYLEDNTVLVNPTSGTISRAAKMKRNYDIYFTPGYSEDEQRKVEAMKLNVGYEYDVIYDIKDRDCYFGPWSYLSTQVTCRHKQGFYFSRDVLLAYGREILELYGDFDFLMKFKTYTIRVHDYSHDRTVYSYKPRNDIYTASALAICYFSTIREDGMFPYVNKFVVNGPMISSGAFLRYKKYFPGRLQKVKHHELGEVYIQQQDSISNNNIVDLCSPLMFKSRQKIINDYYEQNNWKRRRRVKWKKWSPHEQFPMYFVVVLEGLQDYIVVNDEKYVLYEIIKPAIEHYDLRAIDDELEYWEYNVHYKIVEQDNIHTIIRADPNPTISILSKRLQRERLNFKVGSLVTTGEIIYYNMCESVSSKKYYDVTDQDLQHYDNNGAFFDENRRLMACNVHRSGSSYMMKTADVSAVTDKFRLTNIHVPGPFYTQFNDY